MKQKQPSKALEANLVYHPVRESHTESWFPGNEAARILVQADHVWEDIGIMCGLYKQQKDDYTKKLLIKYAIIEVCSIIDLVDSLQTIAFKAPTSEIMHLSRSLLPSEREAALVKFKNFNKMKSDHQKALNSIRNRFAAHRSDKDWDLERLCWAQLSPSFIDPIIKVVRESMMFVRTLDLFEWNRTYDDGSFEILGPRFDFKQMFADPLDAKSPGEYAKNNNSAK